MHLSRHALVAAMALVVVALATSADAAETFLGKPAPGDLKDTKICYYGKACKFVAKLHSSVKDHALSASGSGSKKKTGFPSSVIFEITSQCGSKTHEFFRMDVLKFRTAHSKGTGAGMRQYPVFFDQNRKTGRIDKFYFSKKEKKRDRTIKHGILESVAKRVHVDALEKAKSKPKGEALSYIYEGSDGGGHFTAHHRFESTGDGDVLLTERVAYHQGKKRYEEKNKRKVSTKVPKAAAEMDFKQKRASSVKMTGHGHITKNKQKDSVKLGSAKAERKPESSGKGMPSPGKGTAGCKTVVQRLGKRTVGNKCRSNAENPQVQTALELELGGPGHLGMREFREPHSQDELGAYDVDDVDVSAMVSRATKLMESNGIIDIADLDALMHPKTVVPIAQAAVARYQGHELSDTNMKVVLGALATVRSDDSYKELLAILQDRVYPLDIRQQAALSLHNLNEMEPTPAFVIHKVSDLATDFDDPITHDAKLLLGSVVKSHPDTHLQHTHVNVLAKELDKMDPNSAADQQKICVALEAMSNAGRGAAAFREHVRRFEDSKILAVSMAAQNAANMMETGGDAVQVLEHHEEDDLEEGELQETIHDIDEGETMHDEEPVVWKPQTHLVTDALAMTLLETEATASTMKEYGAGSGTSAYKDGDKKSIGAPAMLNAVKKKNLIDLIYKITGNREFHVKVFSKSGGSYADEKVGGFGQEDLETRIYFYRHKIATFEYNAGIAPAGGRANPVGSLQFIFKLVGATVFTSQEAMSKKTISFGGVCASDYFDAQVTKKPTSKEYFRTFYQVIMVFPVGPVPVLTTVKLVGMLGFTIAYQTWINCVTSRSMENVDTSNNPGAGNSMSAIMGGEIRGKVNVVLETKALVPEAQAGWEGKFVIIRGRVPTTTNVDNNMLCSKCILQWWLHGGKIEIWAQIKAQRWRKTFLEWEGPAYWKEIQARCFGPIQVNNFVGNPDTSGPQDKAELSAAASGDLQEGNLTEMPANVASAPEDPPVRLVEVGDEFLQ